MDDITLPRSEWTPLPDRSKGLFVFDNLLIFGVIAIPLAIGSWVLMHFAFNFTWYWPIAILIALLGLGYGYYRGVKVHKRFRWKVDETGVGITSGHLLMKDVRVPIQRVQHLNIARGPLQRRRNVANLTIFTAGTAHSSVKIRNMDSDVAEAVRDFLSSRIDWIDE